jgi:cobyric acid synthase
MVQGTASSAKSLLTTGLCAVLDRLADVVAGNSTRP